MGLGLRLWGLGFGGWGLGFLEIHMVVSQNRGVPT